MIILQHIAKDYPNPNGGKTPVLRDVNCQIDKGEIVSIIGPSGSGKSTLLRCLNLLVPPTSGQIIVDGEDITRKGYPLHLLRQKMGMVFQNFNLFDHLNILDNITLAPIKLQGLDRQQAEEEGLEQLRKVGLVEKAHAMPSSLSGGQKQRAAIARCLAMKPDIILFDEPTSSLDPTMVGEVQGVIRTLAQEKMTMIIVTHEMKFARDISTRILFIYDGIIQEDGTPEQIFNHPQKPVTRDFVQRIRSLVFDIESRNFDFYDMMSQIRQFCIRYGIPEQMNTITHIVEEMLLLLSAYKSPVHIEVNHSELNGNSSVVILHCGERVSPFDRPDADELAVMIIQGMSKEIETEQTEKGIKLTFKI